MFGKNGKIHEQPRAKRRHGPAWYVIGVFTFAIESMLGINAAFLVYQSVSVVAAHMLEGTFLAGFSTLITLVVSLAVGFSFIFGGMWTFSGFMNQLEDATSFMNEYGTWWWPVGLVWAIAIAIIGLDLMTLLFRASYFAEKGAVPLFIFFCILIMLPFILGCQLHVQEHTPRVRRLAKARVYAEALETDDITRIVELMDPDLRSRWLSDDATALAEHYDRIEGRKQEVLALAQQQASVQAGKQATRNRPLVSAFQNFQAMLGSVEKNGSN